MNYGFQLSASGVLSNMYRMDVLANNLSNASTIGYKPDRVAFIQRDPARIEDGLTLTSNQLLERLGGGILAAPNRVSQEQGSISRTGNTLDLAIRGEGFFVVQDSSGGRGDRLRLTRDGRFTRNAQGELVSTTTGYPVMDVGNRSIFLPSTAPVTIDAAGNVRQNGAVLAKIQVASVENPNSLRKMGHGMFVPSSNELSNLRPGTGIIEQSAVEEASVDPIAMMMQITDAGRAAESNMGMISNHDRMLERLINTFGRVS